MLEVISEATFSPLCWLVTVSIQSPLTDGLLLHPATGLPLGAGAALPIMQHECRDRGHAATLLTELRELAEDLAQSGLLPGLSVAGYEFHNYEFHNPEFAAPKRAE